MPERVAPCGCACACSLIADEPNPDCAVHSVQIPPRCPQCGRFLPSPFAVHPTLGGVTADELARADEIPLSLSVAA